MKRLRQGIGAVLKAGPIPSHVAFIMDGNRRFADRVQAGDRAAGHSKGFLKAILSLSFATAYAELLEMMQLMESLEWCLEIGVYCVSVYAFSIANFNRSEEEVKTLMQLAEAKLSELIQEHALVEQYGVQVRVIGDLTLLPTSVQTAAEKVMDATRTNTRTILNICLAYTSSQEIGHAVADVQNAMKAGSVSPQDVNAHLLQQQLYTKGCPDVDLLVRTSGECRLSDFLLWQSSHALLHFTPALWPDFSFLDLLRALVRFQLAAPHLQRLRQHSSPGAAGGWNRVAAAGEQQEVVALRECDGKREEGSEDAQHDDTSGVTGRVTRAQQDRPNITQASVSSAAVVSSLVASRVGGQGHTPARVNLHVAATPCRRNARSSLDRRKQLATQYFVLPDSQLDEQGLFAEKRPLKAADRSSELRAAGFSGGYDSMEDDEDEGNAHINGCPCCIVRFLPMHRACKDPTLAVAAMRSVRGEEVLDK